MTNPNYRINGYYFLLSAFAAFASYRLHLEGFEEVVGNGLNAIIDGTGRAPDQYRILPYKILSFIRTLMSPWVGLQWKYPVLIFESLSLFGAVYFLRGLSANYRKNHIFLTMLLLIYPYLMFDGVRSTASFILLLSSATVFLFNHATPSVSMKVGFYSTLILFSFTRADIALLIGLVCSVYMSFVLWEKFIVVGIPIIVQLLLSNTIYPGAKYYSELIMVTDNLSLLYFINNPTTYLLAALAIFYWERIRELVTHLHAENRFVLIIIAGYILTVFVIGRPNEYRLFLPLLPVILLIANRRQIATT